MWRHTPLDHTPPSRHFEIWGVQNVWGNAPKNTPSRKISEALQKSFWPAQMWTFVQEKTEQWPLSGKKRTERRGGVLREVFLPPPFLPPPPPMAFSEFSLAAALAWEFPNLVVSNNWLFAIFTWKRFCALLRPFALFCGLVLGTTHWRRSSFKNLFCPKPFVHPTGLPLPCVLGGGGFPRVFQSESSEHNPRMRKHTGN